MRFRGELTNSYYDARPDYTTFIALRNGSEGVQAVNVLFYGQDVTTPFSKTVVFNGGELKIIDVGSLRSEGLPAEPGVAIATTVNGDGEPIATGSLAGSFTVANLLTGSAFGAPGAARSAFTDAGNLLPSETVIGPATGVLQLIQPRTALLAAFYDPATLAPASNGGNQLVFIDFVDTYGTTYGAAIGGTTWNVFAFASNGVGFPDRILSTEGVVVTDLASVLGPGVNGSGGAITFVADSGTPSVNRRVFFAEALGTFGTGYMLPPLQVRLLENN